jgi:hypothetical protein
MPPSPKIPIAPGTSWDGRHGASQYWGKHQRMVKMCPHVKPGGRQCGLQAAHCMCMCLLCGSPMKARKRCNQLLTDGTRCPWGQDRSPEVSTPEQESPPVQPPHRTHWHAAAYGAKSPAPGPAPSIPPLSSWLADESIGNGVCLPNLMAGGPDGLPPQTPRKRTPDKPKAAGDPFTLTPTPPHSPKDKVPAKPLSAAKRHKKPSTAKPRAPAKPRAAVKPATKWNRTLFATMGTSSSIAPPPIAARSPPPAL